MSQALDCDFCLIPQVKTTEAFKNMYGNISHTVNIPGVPSNFTVLQDVVPIAELGAHLLIMPNVHNISLASVENQKDIATARDAIIKGLKKHFPYNPIFVFEHGPGFIQGEPIACGGCHMDHAHGHFMVLPKKTLLAAIRDRMEEALIANGWINPRNQAVESKDIFTNPADAAGIQPYIHIGMILPDGNAVSYTYVQTSKAFNVPSQLLRLVIADIAYGQKDPTYWHWRDIESGLTLDGRQEELQANIYAFRKITGF